MSLTFDKEGSFRHDAKEIEDLSDHPFKTVTLAEWRAEHPETDVYVGEFPTPDLQMESTLQHMTTDERIEADRVLEERSRQRKELRGQKPEPAEKTRRCGK